MKRSWSAAGIPRPAQPATVWAEDLSIVIPRKVVYRMRLRCSTSRRAAPIVLN